MKRALFLAALLGLATPALAQVQSGLYDAVGTDSALGPYTGQVQLVDRGSHMEYVRLVRYANALPSGKTLVTAWIGVGARQGNDLNVAINLNRIDWITEANGLQRTVADQIPDAVIGTYRPDPAGGLSVQLASSGGVSAAEALTRVGGPGSGPLFVDQRIRRPIHGNLPGWLRTILFALFSDYHTLAEVQPYVNRPDFQAAVHIELEDFTGFDYLRANPNHLLVLNKRVDAISLAEAEVVNSAFALRLHEKAANYDRDVTTGRHLNHGILAFGVRPDPSAPGGLDKLEDMSSFLWSACYLFGQRCRYLATQSPEALANVERMIEVFCDMVEIDPRPGEFARSLRDVNRSPNTGRWHAGTGRFAHLAYHDNGNNDMIKGFWLGFFAAWDVLPQNHPLRPRIQACVREIADDWAASNPSAAGGTGHSRDRPNSHLMNGMLAHWITGDARYERLYKDQLREPMLLLEMAVGGSLAAYGFGDWSGTHLGACTDIARIELGRKLGSRWSPLFEHALRMNWRWLHKYRRTETSVAAAALLGLSEAKDESLRHLREFPYPKPKHGVDRSLDPTYSLSPFPSKPWKRDWMQGHRIKALSTYPVYMRNADNYVYRSGSFNRGGGPTPTEHHGGDYLFLYWMARHYGVIPANE